MASGSRFGLGRKPFVPPARFHSLKFDIVGIPGRSRANLVFHGTIVDTRPLLAKADLLVTNAGFSALSEAIHFELPTVAIPINNHAEQLLNARRLEELGLGIAASEQDWSERLDHLIHHFSDYMGNHRNFPHSETGAFEAASIVHRLCQEKAHASVRG